MRRTSRGLLVLVAVLALWRASTGLVHAQVAYYQPVPPVTVAPVPTYYAPPPVVSYYASPPVVTTYYAPAPAPVVASYYPAPAVTTYRYGPLGRLRSVRSYYGAPVVTRYGYFYP
jgi:hypothetical protein